MVEPAIHSQMVNLRGLKQFADKRLNHLSNLRRVLLIEKDEILVSEYLAKMQVWLALLQFEGRIEQ